MGDLGYKQDPGGPRGGTKTCFSEKNMSGHLLEDFAGPGGHFWKTSFSTIWDGPTRSNMVIEEVLDEIGQQEPSEFYTQA